MKKPKPGDCFSLIIAMNDVIVCLKEVKVYQAIALSDKLSMSHCSQWRNVNRITDYVPSLSPEVTQYT